MQAPEKTRSLKYVWISPGQLDDVWRVQEQSDLKHPHPKSYYEEQIRYGRCLVAYDSEIPVALLTFEVLWGNTPFFELAKVLDSHQRKGIGKSLVRHLEGKLKSLGFASYITSSENVNQKTKRFFPDLGFEYIGELKMAHGGEIFYLKKLV